MATAATKPAKKAAPKTGPKSAPKATETFSAEERAAMKEAVREARRGKNVDGEAEVLAKIADMADGDREMATRIHAIVKRAAPQLTSKTWYGMPAYVNAEGRTICFFQAAAKFKTRYGTLGFQDAARLDDGNVWANAYAITKLTAADEEKIAALIKRAVG